MPSVPDFTDKYNTTLPPAKEEQFQAWLRLNKRQGDLADYDLRGAWQSGAKQAADGHFTDKYKKPNHPTFSDESIYSGKDGNVGGHWDSASGKDSGPWTYTPSDTNLKFRTVEELDDYFMKDEPGNSIAWKALTGKKP